MMDHTISLNQNGICLNGTYKTLLVSSFFYFRIPRIRWKQRMLLLKAAGYHAIDVYFPWNYHETAPGSWQFEDNRDVTAFLQLAGECGMYVIARPGPYICSEWDGGALPAWLYADQVNVRQNDPDFLNRLDQWYAHILPLIAPFQITKGGTVLCMQIENELDFFDCKSPVSYMEKLMAKSSHYGIEVPLFYCCGQNDMLRAGGLTPSLYTAFNVYADSCCDSLEQRVRSLCSSAGERDMPLMVSETNREHSFLKRLLACGAKLISPYNQTAGSTIEWYNGLTNWGSKEAPLSLLASDYDFDSMIGSAGEVNEQFYEARLLSSLLYTMGEALACALPAKEDTSLQLRSSQPHNTYLPVLHTSEGDFVAVSNLGGDCEMTLTGKDFELPLTMPAGYTSLLPLSVTVSAGQNITLCCSNYELCYRTEEDGAVRIGLYGSGPLSAILSINGRIEQIRLIPEGDTGSVTVSCVTIVYGTKQAMALSSLPGLPDMARSTAEQETPFAIHALTASPYVPEVTNRRQTPVLPMEVLHQYRGAGCYRFSLADDCDVLFVKAADILSVARNAIPLETFYGRGHSVERHMQAGTYDVTAEIWGHSNFNDVRCRSLVMNSLKGLHDIVVLHTRLDLSDNWLFDLDESAPSEWYFFRHSPFNTVMGIDSYNRAVSPLNTVYDRWIDVDSDADSLYLHLSEADCLIDVYVNNQLVESVSKDDPYVDISSFAGGGRIELTLRVKRRYFSDAVGKVTLLAGRRISSCEYGCIEIEQAAMPSVTCTRTLPAVLTPGETMLFSLDIPDGTAEDIKLFFKGRDVKLTIMSNHRVIGRVILPNDVLPVVKGGRPDVLFLCREWVQSDALLILCQPIGSAPLLESISCISYTSVCQEA